MSFDSDNADNVAAENNDYYFLLNVFSQDSYLTVNLPLARAIGLHETVLYSNLISKYKYYIENNAITVIDGKKYFYSTIEDLEYSTTLSRKQQDKAISTLVDVGLIEKKVLGVPAKRFFRIITDARILCKLINIDTKDEKIQFVQKGQTRMSKMDKLECPKGTNKNVQKGQENLLNKSLNKSLDKNNNNTPMNKCISSSKKTRKQQEKKTTILSLDEQMTMFRNSLGENDNLLQLLSEFIEIRRIKKTVATKSAITRLINKLKPYDDNTRIDMLEKAIVGSWTSVYPPKEKGVYRNARADEGLARSTSRENEHRVSQDEWNTFVTLKRSIEERKEKERTDRENEESRREEQAESYTVSTEQSKDGFYPPF